jgi:hypothetical protein
MAKWRMRIACRIPKATNTLSEYVMLIAFLLYQCLHECPSMLRWTYNCLSGSLLFKVKTLPRKRKIQGREIIMKKVTAEINEVRLDAFDDRCVPPLKGG